MDRPDQTIQKTSETVASITTRPGVYLYSDRHGTVLYVGKARNLRRRITQYFTRDDAIGQKTHILVQQIASIKTIATDSEFDAILLEASLIRAYLPKYNAITRDDKSPLYIVITFDEAIPQIFFTRKRTVESWHPIPKKRFIAGPFQSSRILRRLMQSLRRIIPYCTQKRRDGRPCFHSHLGLCSPCPSMVVNMSQTHQKYELLRLYKKNLRRIALLLSGHARSVRVQLEKSMYTAAKQMKFEEAAVYKRQLTSLDTLLTTTFDPSLYTDQTSAPNQVYLMRLTDLSQVLSHYGFNIQSLSRIECIDISTLFGMWATGSLVVFTDGIPDTDQYRRFRVKNTDKLSDVHMMAEIISRRFAHSEWNYPNLLVVDGGAAQVTAAERALAAIAPAGNRLRDHNLKPYAIPVIGLAKRFEELILPSRHGCKRIRLERASPGLQLVQHIRDEAHRFAKRYHHFLRTKSR